MEFEVNVPISPVNFSKKFKSLSNQRLTYIINDAIPTGLVLNLRTGILSGIPTVSGIFNNVKILVIDANQKQLLSSTFSIDIFSVESVTITAIAGNDVFMARELFNIRIKSFD